jgi:hypothetical protein
MSVLTRKRLRLAVQVESYGEFLDALTRAGPQVWAANDLSVEIGLLEGYAPLDVSDVTSVIVHIKDPADLSGDPILAGSTTSINTGLTQAAWEGGAPADAHATIVFTAAQMNLDLGEAASKDYHVVVMVTTDGGTKLVTAGVSTLTVRNDGFNFEATARQWRSRGGVLQIKNVTTGNFHSLTADTSGEATTLKVDQAGDLDDGVYDDGFALPTDGDWRDLDGTLQLKNATTGLFHSVTAGPSGEAVTLKIEQTGEA